MTSSPILKWDISSLSFPSLKVTPDQNWSIMCSEPLNDSFGSHLRYHGSLSITRVVNYRRVLTCCPPSRILST